MLPTLTFNIKEVELGRLVYGLTETEIAAVAGS